VKRRARAPAIEHAEHPRPRLRRRRTQRTARANDPAGDQNIVRLLERNAGFDDDLTGARHRGQ
jgi:hypothetical protein